MKAQTNRLLRHSLSTIAYRFQASVHEAGEDFGNFDAGHGTRTPCQIITHLAYLVQASGSMIQKKTFSSKRLETLNLQAEIDRFNNQLKVLDTILKETDLPEKAVNKLLQGPIADILTHVGQLALLRRLNGNPTGISGFSSAPIKVGQLSYF